MRTAGAVSDWLTASGDGLSGRAKEAWPGWLAAFSLSGIYVYFGLLDLVDARPRTPVTGAYYAVLGAALLAAVWHLRDRLLTRLAVRAATVRVAVIAAAFLAAWFVVNVALVSEGTLPWKLALLLVLWSLPTALVVGSLDSRGLRDVAEGLTVLGLTFVAFELVAIANGVDDGTRFSPIDSLNPISAGNIAAAGTVGALAIGRDWPRPLAGIAVTLLVAGTVLPGSRGPVVAAIAGCVVAVAISGRRLLTVVAPSLVIGLAVGMVASRASGSDEHLTEPLHDVPGFLEGRGDSRSSSAIETRPVNGSSGQPTQDVLVAHKVTLNGDDTGGTGAFIEVGSATPTQSTLIEAQLRENPSREEPQQAPPAEPEPISSISIRRKWLEDAISQTPESPLWGQGVAMLVDDTEEAHRMGIAGTRTYPHNSLVESAFSLGLLGFVPFVALLGATCWALLSLVRRGPPPVFTAEFVAFAFAASMTSGEIGGDAPLWAAIAITITGYADQMRFDASSR